MFHRSVALAVAMIFAMLAPSQPFPLSPPAQLHGAPRFRAGPRPQRALQLCMQRKPWERDEASQRGNTGTAVSNKKVSIGSAHMLLHMSTHMSVHMFTYMFTCILDRR